MKKKNNLSPAEQEFEKYLEKIEDPNYQGADSSWGLPENATPLEKVKYEICEKILGYQQNNNLSDKEIAERIHLTTGEVRDILYCHTDCFTLDRLLTYASYLFSPSQVKVIIEPENSKKTSHARVI
jgi:predicted XRE-type DNA-binding protein